MTTMQSTRLHLTVGNDNQTTVLQSVASLGRTNNFDTAHRYVRRKSLDLLDYNGCYALVRIRRFGVNRFYYHTIVRTDEKYIVSLAAWRSHLRIHRDLRESIAASNKEFRLISIFYLSNISICCTYWKLVRITIGWPKKLRTDSSIKECALMKFNVRSGRLRELLTHCPGRGSGTLALCTGSQFESKALCSLKLPSNVWAMSLRENAHTAEPLILFTGVVNVPYINWADSLPYWPAISSVVDSATTITVMLD